MGLSLLKFMLVFTFSLSVFAQDDSGIVSGKKSILDLPVGTLMTVDGKGLNKLQKKCPEKIKEKMIIQGEEVEVETSNLLFQDGKAKCYGGVSLSLIISDLSGRYVSLKGKVPNKEPLQCKVKEVTEVLDNIAIQLDSPCNVSLFFNRAAFDFRDVKDLSIESFQYNLGNHITFSLDHEHNSPAQVNSGTSSLDNSVNGSSNSSGSNGHEVIQD
jgi:hypothetical protein